MKYVYIFLIIFISKSITAQNESAKTINGFNVDEILIFESSTADAPPVKDRHYSSVFPLTGPDYFFIELRLDHKPLGYDYNFKAKIEITQGYNTITTKNFSINIDKSWKNSRLWTGFRKNVLKKTGPFTIKLYSNNSNSLASFRYMAVTNKRVPIKFSELLSNLRDLKKDFKHNFENSHYIYLTTFKEYFDNLSKNTLINIDLFIQNVSMAMAIYNTQNVAPIKEIQLLAEKADDITDLINKKMTQSIFELLALKNGSLINNSTLKSEFSKASNSNSYNLFINTYGDISDMCLIYSDLIFNEFIHNK